MQRRQVRRSIHAGSAMLLVGAASVGYLSLRPTAESPQDRSPAIRAIPETVSIDDSAKRDEMRRALNRLAVRPLQGSPRLSTSNSGVGVEKRVAAKPPIAVPPKPMVKMPLSTRSSKALDLRLLGTVVEPGRSVLISEKETGVIDFHAEGQTIAIGDVSVSAGKRDQEPDSDRGVRIDSIGAGWAWVTYRGHRSRWEVGQPLALNLDGSSPVKVEDSALDEVEMSPWELGEPGTFPIESDPPSGEQNIQPRQLTEAELFDELDALNGDAVDPF